MNAFQISEQQVAQFDADGYLFVPKLLDNDETRMLHNIAKNDQTMVEKSRQGHGRDKEGKSVSILIHNDLSDDIYSAIVRTRRIVDTMERLLRGEVYHYHNKMTMKAPYEGGAWEWHQDYGYWYNNGCIYPHMGSVMIAVDRCTRDNGCLQVLRGSHECGRIEHGVVATQTGADVDRVEQIMKRLELVYCVMEPGDGLFFHCNTLHRSDANRSPDPRWSFLCCYNAARNDPYKKHGHPNYSFLEKWDDDRIMEVGSRVLAATGAGT